MTTLPINADWFKQQLEQKRLSQRKLARFLELDPSAITLTLQGRRRLQMDEALKIASFLGVDVDEVLKNAGIPTKQQMRCSVPLIGIVGDDGEIHSVEMGRDVEAPLALPSGTVAIRVKGDGDFINGCTIFFKPQDSIDPGAVGRMAVVQIRSGAQKLARLSPGEEPGLYDLILPNGKDLGVMISSASHVIFIRP